MKSIFKTFQKLNDIPSPDGNIKRTGQSAFHVLVMNVKKTRNFEKSIACSAENIKLVSKGFTVEN